jgi:hypothetical protein
MIHDIRAELLERQIKKLKELVDMQGMAISYFRKYSGEAERITRFMASIGIIRTELVALEQEQEQEWMPDLCCGVYKQEGQSKPNDDDIKSSLTRILSDYRRLDSYMIDTALSDLWRLMQAYRNEGLREELIKFLDERDHNVKLSTKNNIDAVNEYLKTR